MRNTLLLVGILLASCGSVSKNEVHETGRSTGQQAPLPNVEVTWRGELKSVFAGDWTSKATLQDALAGPNAYGLGALSELRGEFLVSGGRVMLAYPTPEALPKVVAQHAGSAETATLLVGAEVARWRETTLEQDVSSDLLEETVRASAVAAGLDVSKPFPFLLRGVFRKAEWHVADGTRVQPGMRPDQDAQHGTIEEAEGTIVGFYSTQHQGVFTMMGQNTHMHVALDDHSVVGHVRALEVAKGTVLSLPE